MHQVGRSLKNGFASDVCDSSSLVVKAGSIRLIRPGLSVAAFCGRGGSEQGAVQALAVLAFVRHRHPAEPFVRKLQERGCIVRNLVFRPIVSASPNGVAIRAVVYVYNLGIGGGTCGEEHAKHTC